jgi:hypothetical protein
VCGAMEKSRDKTGARFSGEAFSVQCSKTKPV